LPVIDVRAFCCNPVPIRKGRPGKAPTYDARVTKTLRSLLRTAFALLLSAAIGSTSGAAAGAREPESAAPRGGPTDPDTTALRITGSALGASLEIDVRDLSRAAGERALHAAWDAVVRAESELGSLARRAEGSTAALSEDLFGLLLRADSFCTWSDGACGPAGGAVYRLWSASAASGALPPPGELAAAAATTPCQRLKLRPATRTLELSAGSELDLRGFARGWAVDLAVRALTEAGAANAKVVLGRVVRAMGRGPEGRGWPIPLPALSASGNPQSLVLLVDEALAVADPAAGALLIGGESIPPAFDLRTGRPATGVSSVVTVSPLAADAEPLALAMSVLGANGGQMRLGSLRPKPAVLWLLGSGSGAVVASSNWSAVRRP
jgi:thiamine biosynthesis lipoprotein